MPPPPSSSSGPGQDRKNTQRQPPNPWFWWIVFAVLIAWNFFIFWPRSNKPAALPYSTFLAQVNDGNISQVHIVGDQITGDLIKPLLWPPAAATPAHQVPHHPAQSKAAPTPAPANSGAASSKAAHAQKPRNYKQFTTTFPQTVGDPGLIALLQAHHVTIEVSSERTPWLLDIVMDWFPMLLLIGFFWWIAARGAQNQAGILGRFGRMKAKRYQSGASRVTFKDVAGAEEAKAELREEVDFLQNPSKYHEMGARIPKGILLIGSPGTGKTLLARAVAGEANVPFFSLNASEFVEMFVGVGASRVRDLFNQAREAAPAIVFIDELDAVGRRRGAGVGAVNDEREQTLNQMLGEMDGFDPRFEVIIMAATNRPDVLDPALLRPGRFDRQVVVGLPDRNGREGILRIHSRNLPLAPDVNLAILAQMTIGMSGADLANLCNEAALTAARRDHSTVTMMDFEEAQDKIRLGAAHIQVIDPAERRVVAYHEAGHAIVAWLTAGADQVRKVTIVPHGQALGMTEQLPGEDRHNLSQSYLLTRLAVMLGGRSAEEIACGEITTGAENDLIEATKLARRMITRWGMGELGVVAFKTDDQQPFLGYDIAQGRDYSESTAALIDRNVADLLEHTHAEVRKLISGARAKLDRLVEALLEHETIGQEQLLRILGARPALGKSDGIKAAAG